MRAICLVFLVVAGAASAQEMLTGEAFRNLTEGKRFYYLQNGVPYGQEAYLPGGEVQWSLFGRPREEACVVGRWWAEDGQICFLYEDDPGFPHCWDFWLVGGTIHGRYLSADFPVEGYTVEETTDALPCRGPFLGVRWDHE